MAITERAARRNPRIRARLFREFVCDSLEKMPHRSGGATVKRLAEAFGMKYGVGVPSQPSRSNQINRLVEEGRVRRVDHGRYARADDKGAYPEDFRQFLIRYARINGESCLKDAMLAFASEHKRYTRLGRSEARRMLRQAIHDGVLRPVVKPRGETLTDRTWFRHAMAPEADPFT